MPGSRNAQSACRITRQRLKATMRTLVPDPSPAINSVETGTFASWEGTRPPWLFKPADRVGLTSAMPVRVIWITADPIVCASLWIQQANFLVVRIPIWKIQHRRLARFHSPFESAASPGFDRKRSAASPLRQQGLTTCR